MIGLCNTESIFLSLSPFTLKCIWTTLKTRKTGTSVSLVNFVCGSPWKQNGSESRKLWVGLIHEICSTREDEALTYGLLHLVDIRQQKATTVPNNKHFPFGLHWLQHVKTMLHILHQVNSIKGRLILPNMLENVWMYVFC